MMTGVNSISRHQNFRLMLEHYTKSGFQTSIFAIIICNIYMLCNPISLTSKIRETSRFLNGTEKKLFQDEEVLKISPWFFVLFTFFSICGSLCTYLKFPRFQFLLPTFSVIAVAISFFLCIPNWLMTTEWVPTYFAGNLSAYGFAPELCGDSDGGRFVTFLGPSDEVITKTCLTDRLHYFKAIDHTGFSMISCCLRMTTTHTLPQPILKMIQTQWISKLHFWALSMFCLILQKLYYRRLLTKEAQAIGLNWYFESSQMYQKIWKI